MENLKLRLVLSLSTAEAIDQLKKEAIPLREVVWDKNKRCPQVAGVDVKDDWGDSCEGQQCCLERSHPGKHMSSDGANGWVYFK